MKTRNPSLFVVGCPRSGTTLLQRMLDSHPEMAVTFMKFIRGLEFRSGQKGFLEGLKERLKSLGYF